MASLTGQLVAETYKALLKLVDNDILTASEKQITDGFGGGSNVFIDSQGFLRANKYKITNGLATQFLKADGSLDSNAYLTSITGTQVITALGYTPVPTTRTITINGETHNLAADNSWTVGGTAAIWGNITGTLSNQTDLQNALNAKYNNPTGTISQYIRGDGSIANFPALTGYVPYSGATSNVNLGEYGITSGFVGFDTTPTGTPTGIGTLYWDSANRTLSLIDGDGDTTLQIGQEERVLVHNNTGATLTDGQIVYVTGSTGELPSVALASNSAEATSSVTFGMVTESIAHGADGFITTSGIVHGLNTLAFTEGAALWLGTTPGTFTQTKPVAPLNSVLVGYVIKKAGGNGSVFVKIQNGYELEELHDVYIADPANNHGLFYDIADGLWKNKSIASALGYTPQAQLSGTGFVKASGTTITYDNSTYLTTADAASTYQRLDKMVSNLLPSATEYPNSNAVIAALALKADAANPVFTGNMTISGAEPKLYFTDIDQNPDYFIGVDAGFFRVYDQTAGATRFVINSDGNISTGVGKSITAGSFIKDGGTATQFLKADGSVDSTDYATVASLANYLLSATAASTYQTLANLSTDLTASATKYPSVNAVNAGLATKQPLDADLTAIAGLTGTSGFLKKTAADTWTLDISTYLTTGDASTTYLAITTAASTYQRLDKMVSNLLPSSTEYPNSNAVINALALKADAANPVFTGNMTISGATPRLYFVDTDQNPDYTVFIDSGFFYIYDQTAGATRFSINSSGNINTGVGKSITAGSFIKESGTSSQYLMADGSVSTFAGVTGSGTTNYLPKWTSASAIGNSVIFDNGNIGIRTTSTYSPLTVQGYGIAWGENSTFYASSSGYTTLAFWLQGATDYTGTWVISKQSRTVEASVEYFQIAKNGLTGSALHRADALQSWDVNGNSYFGYKVGIGTMTPSASKLSLGMGVGVKFLIYDNPTTGVYSGLGQDMAAGDSIDLFAHGLGGLGFITFGQLATNKTTYTEWARFRTNGWFGIGTTSPDARLHVQSPTVAYGQIRFLNSSADGEATIHIGRSGQTAEQRWTFGQGPAGIGDNFGFYTLGSNKFTLSTAGAGTFLGSVTAGAQMSATYYRVSNSNGVSGYLIPQATWFGTGVATNLLLAAEGGNSIGFMTNGTTDFRMFINTSGNIGVGTTSPSSRLSLGTGIGAKFLIYDNASNVFSGIGQDLAAGNSTDFFAHGAGGGFLTFGMLGTNKTTYTEWMRINPSGNVGVGLTNPQSQFHMNGVFTFTESGYDTVRKHQIDHSHSDGNSANNNLRFLVSDGSGSTAERMRINGLGNVGIGNSGLAALGKTLTVEGTIISQTGAGGGNYNENMRANRAGNGYSAIAMGGAYGSTSGTGTGQWTLVATPAGVNYNFEFDYAGATKVAFSTGGNITATAFFESSDIRLKTLIESNPIIDGIEKLEAKLYEKEGKIEIGYFAQDAELIMPYAVQKNHDGFLNLSYREVHTAKIARLEKRVAELEKQLNVA